jgi:hypothetical protein
MPDAQKKCHQKEVEGNGLKAPWKKRQIPYIQRQDLKKFYGALNSLTKIFQAEELPLGREILLQPLFNLPSTNAPLTVLPLE